LSLSNPAFSNTELGLAFAPGKLDPATCSTPATTSPFAVDPGASTTAKGDILQALSLRNPDSTAAGKIALKGYGAPGLLHGVLRDVYAAMEVAKTAKGGDFYKRAVLVIGNRDLATNSCGGLPITLAADAHGKGVNTYFAAFASEKILVNGT